MHYHIVWGPITSKEPTILNYTDRTEALEKFIEIGQAVEAAEKFDNLPGTAVKFQLDKQTLVFKVETTQTKICFLYCEHECPSEEKPFKHQLN